MTTVSIKNLDSVTANDTTATATINSNFKTIKEALAKSLSRKSDEPNYMDTDLDMNSYSIINVKSGTGPNDVVVRKDVEEALEAAKGASASAAAAAKSEQNAKTYATNALNSYNNARRIADSIPSYDDYVNIVNDNTGRIIQLGFDGKLESDDLIVFRPQNDETYEVKDGYEYELDLYYDASSISDDTHVLISVGNAMFNILNPLHTEASELCQVSDLKQMMTYTDGVGYRWIFNAKCINNEKKLFVQPSTVVNVESNIIFSGGVTLNAWKDSTAYSNYSYQETVVMPEKLTKDVLSVTGNVNFGAEYTTTGNLAPFAYFSVENNYIKVTCYSKTNDSVIIDSIVAFVEYE
jgi:hypothetical protein